MNKFKDMWWNTTSDEKLKEANPHLKNLIGKNMEELCMMFPDAKICDSKNCDFNNLDHAIFMEAEQDIKNAERKGMIRVMYIMNYPEPDTKLFLWFNGKEWIELK